MGRALIEAPEPGVQHALDVGEGRDVTDVREGLFAHAAPETLHLAARRGVIRLGVQERDSESGAHQLKDLTAVGRAVVEVKCVGFAVRHQGLREDGQHRLFPLVPLDPERHDIA